LTVEKVREQDAQATRSPNKLGGNGNDAVQKAGTVTVMHGVHRLPNQRLEGKTVGEVRRQLATALNIDPQAKNLVSGKEVNEKHELKSGDTLEFVKLAGSKGQQ
jgi:hypothetical protein